MPEYRLQIVDSQGVVVASWVPGRKYGADANFIENIASRVLTKSVGVLRTKLQVTAAVREALEEALIELKSKV